MSKWGLMLASVVCLFLPACQQVDSAPRGPFLGLEPTAEPQLFPDFINTSMIEFNGTFNPEGTEFYFTTDIPGQGIISFSEMQADGSWTNPAIASFSGTWSDYDPLLSPDGGRLYFSSRRPVPGLIENRSNIWFVERSGDGWTTPQYVFLNDHSAYYSSLSSKGDLYFNAWNTGEIHKAVRQDSVNYLVESLGEMLDSLENEVDPFIAPDESYLIFRGYGEKSFGRADLFISFNLNGRWTPAENLGEPINSAAQEVCPYVTTDGKLFVFSSDRVSTAYRKDPGTPLNEIRTKAETADNGNQNIYYMSADFIEKLRQKYLDGFN
ncbi:MAG: hypothetical protein HEP71_19705 [Roseivirga sp.]|nr:hypothetical protein [Roseivirga sp.]